MRKPAGPVGFHTAHVCRRARAIDPPIVLAASHGEREVVEFLLYYSLGRSYTHAIRDRLVVPEKKNRAAFAGCLKPYRANTQPGLIELRDDVMKMAKTARLSV